MKAASRLQPSSKLLYRAIAAAFVVAVLLVVIIASHPRAQAIPSHHESITGGGTVLKAATARAFAAAPKREAWWAARQNNLSTIVNSLPKDRSVCSSSYKLAALQALCAACICAAHNPTARLCDLAPPRVLLNMQYAAHAHDNNSREFR